MENNEILTRLTLYLYSKNTHCHVLGIFELIQVDVKGDQTADVQHVLYVGHFNFWVCVCVCV